MRYLMCLLIITGCGSKHSFTPPKQNPPTCENDCGPEVPDVPVDPVVDEPTTDIVAVLDPCGDYIHSNGKPEHKHSRDCLLLIFSDGSVSMTLLDGGVESLDPGFSYQTKDKQKCEFFIDLNGSISEY